MTRNLKALGTALVAVLALGAFAAAGASATTGDSDFRAANEHTLFGGSQVGVHQFTIPGTGTWTCETVNFEGTHGGEERTANLSVTPTYEGCHIATTFGNIELEVDHTECGYLFTAPNHNANGFPHEGVNYDFSGTMTIDCDAASGEGIHMEGPGCNITITRQEKGTVLYENVANGDVTVATTLSEIGWEGEGFICEGEGTDMSYQGKVTWSAQDTDGNPVDMSVGTSNGPTHEEETELQQTEEEQAHNEETHEEETELEFHSEATHANLVGEGQAPDTFGFSAGEAKCGESGYRGTVTSKTGPTITLEPEFAGCEAFGFSNGEVKPNGCAYVLHAGTKSGSGALEGTLDVECPEGKAIEVIGRVRGIVKCTATIGAQSGLTGVTFTNSGSGSERHVKFDISAGSVVYTQDAGEGLGKCEGGGFENGKIVADPTVIAENSEKEQLGFWVG